MKTFTFSALSPLQDFQFLTDSSGYILTQAGQLYRFTGQHATLVATPREFTISHFYFRDQTHGALVGIARVAEPLLQKGTVGATAIPLLLLLLLVWKSRRQPTIRRLFSFLGVLFLASGFLFSCSSAWQHCTSDPSSPYATVLTHSPLHLSTFHTYFANKGQQSFVTLTQNQCSSWETHQLPFILVAK